MQNFLASALNALPAALSANLWRAHQVEEPSLKTLASHFPGLDRELPGHGWPVGQLTELLPQRDGIGELRLLLPALARLTQNAQTVLLIAPPELPYPPALAAHGVALEHMLLIQAPQGADRLWTIEQALKSGSLGAVVAWLPEEHGLLVPLDQLRRLQLAAQASDALAFMLRPAVARAVASAAPLRMELQAGLADTVTVDIFKRRGASVARPLAIALPSPLRLGTDRLEPTLQPIAPMLQPAIERELQAA